MSPIWARLAVLVLAGGTISLAQADPTAFETNTTLVGGHDLQHDRAWSDPVPGIKALVGHWQHAATIGRRDCMSNGSNYCFGNDVDFCPRCGTCCMGDSKHCCDDGKVCCGTGCCPAGETCSNGKCLPPVTSTTTVTLTSTISQTQTHIVTQRTTVVVAEIETSTVISTDVVTISTAETQTDVVWTTVTALHRRAASTPRLTRLSEQLGAHEPSLPAALQASREAEGPVPILRREDTTTVTVFVTTTVDVDITSTTSIVTTIHTTSTELTTLYHTITRVLSAETTITMTSTLTVTPQLPSFVTLTSTAILSPAPATTSKTDISPTPSSTDEPQPSGTLPTATIAGIAAGSTVLAILLAGFIILSIRRRSRRRHARDHKDSPAPFDTRRISESMDQRQPTLPRILPHFAPATPAHHAEQFQPPTPYSEYSGKGGGGGDGPRPRGTSDASSQSRRGLSPYHQHQPHDHTGVHQQQQQQHHHLHPHNPRSHHQRNSSGFTTLVGTPSPTAAGFNFKHGLTTPPGDAEAESMGYEEGYHHGPHRQPGPHYYELDQQPPRPSELSSGEETQQQHNRPHSPVPSARERERAWWAELDGSSSRPVSRARSPIVGGGGGGGGGGTAAGAEGQRARNGPAPSPPAELPGDRSQ
ncbi:hypothetical protein VTJ49DRAFT_2340 [Mycothermus thermophilus]|uniref:Uncharacterized protein n=1 Tax=Humicola insolens TaxID=85995 RepID=A0ABR3VQX8_HUMIN